MKTSVKIWSVLLTAICFYSCSDEPDFNPSEYGPGSRLPENMIKNGNIPDFLTYQSVNCHALVYGPEEGYKEDTWHFEWAGLHLYWEEKNLHTVRFYSDNQFYSNLTDQPRTNSNEYWTPLAELITWNLTTDGVTRYDYRTPDYKRLISIFNGGEPIKYINDYSFQVSRMILLDDYVILYMEDNYDKDSNDGSGSIGNGGNNSNDNDSDDYNLTSTKVFEVLVKTSGLERYVYDSSHNWYKGEVAGKVCLFKSKNTKDFFVASNNYDSTCEGYKVSQYSYKVTEYKPGQGTFYYYFN